MLGDQLRGALEPKTSELLTKTHSQMSVSLKSTRSDKSFGSKRIIMKRKDC